MCANRKGETAGTIDRGSARPLASSRTRAQTDTLWDELLISPPGRTYDTRSLHPVPFGRLVRAAREP